MAPRGAAQTAEPRVRRSGRDGALRPTAATPRRKRGVMLPMPPNRIPLGDLVTKRAHQLGGVETACDRVRTPAAAARGRASSRRRAASFGESSPPRRRAPGADGAPGSREPPAVMSSQARCRHAAADAAVDASPCQPSSIGASEIRLRGRGRRGRRTRREGESGRRRRQPRRSGRGQQPRQPPIPAHPLRCRFRDCG
jgi:hypothetical protein